VFDTIEQVSEGGWSGGVHEFGLAEGGVDWVYDARNRHMIPDHVRATVDSLERQIVSGAIEVPAQ
jgi:basic membrane protein A